MENKYTKLFFIALFISVFMLQTECYAHTSQETKFPAIRWECLNLSQAQQARINMLDLNWQKTRESFTAQIMQDKQKLRYLLSNPFALDAEIKSVQQRILINQQKLRNYAMENFLRKRNVLTLLQRKKLHEMLSN